MEGWIDDGIDDGRKSRRRPPKGQNAGGKEKIARNGGERPWGNGWEEICADPRPPSPPPKIAFHRRTAIC